MASKLRTSLVACLFPVVLSAVGTVQTVGTAQAADTAPPTQPSCNSTPLAPSDNQSGGGFGASVAVNGQTALVADPFYDTAFVEPPVNPPYISGRVSVFACDATTQAWTNTATLELPATDANQYITLGEAVALQGDLAAIGASNGVYLYKRQGQNWNQLLQILPNNSQTGITDRWGSVIALDDHVLAVSVTESTSTSTSLFVDLYQILDVDRHAAAIRIARLKPPSGDTGSFGGSLAMTGETLVIGDPPDVSAYVYTRRGLTFKLDQKITGAEATTDSGFGTAVAISKDVILVGAPDENPVSDSFGVVTQGAVYAFRHESGPGSPWVETQHFSPLAGDRYAYFGGAVAVNRNGQAVIGTPRAWDVEEQSEYGPTFLYTLQAGQFVLSLQTDQLSAEVPSSALGMTDEYLISGSLYFFIGGPIANAEITNLSQLPTN
jgi:hypothetical protein